MCAWRPNDPVDALAHGEEVPGVVGPLGLTPDAEAGMTQAEAAAIEQVAEESGAAAKVRAEEPEMGVHEVRRLAMRGIGQILVRTLTLRAVTFAGNILLARILTPKAFGLFAIVNVIVLLASFLADLGIGASLIQRKQRLDEADLRTAFSLGLAFDVAATLIVAGLAPVLVHVYRLEPKYALAVQVMAVTIVISTFANIPAIQLERQLKFKELATIDLLSQLIYVVGAVIGAAAGLHLWCFVVASIASRTANTVMVNVVSPWRPRWGITRASARAMLSFGIPYQLNGMISLFKDNMVPTFVAFVAGARAVGYINWAVGLATNPFFLLTIVSRVTFPAYARLQHDLDALKDSVEKSIKWISATVLPGTFLLAALAQQIVRFLYGPKWAPGLISFYLLCIPVVAASYSTVLVSALYGLGRARTVLKLTVIWAVAGWGLSVPLVLWIGFNGFAISTAIVSVLSVLSVIEMNKIVKISFVPQMLRLGVIAALPAIGVWVMSYRVVHGVPSLLALAGFGVFTYIGLLAMTGEIAEARALVKGVLQRAA